MDMDATTTPMLGATSMKCKDCKTVVWFTPDREKTQERCPLCQTLLEVKDEDVSQYDLAFDLEMEIAVLKSEATE